MSAENKHDTVNHPQHYTSHPSGVECIKITEHFNFCIGNAIKYIWRAGLKNDAIEDLEKARWYIDREIKRRKDMPAEQLKDKPEVLAVTAFRHCTCVKPHGLDGKHATHCPCY